MEVGSHDQPYFLDKQNNSSEYPRLCLPSLDSTHKLLLSEQHPGPVSLNGLKPTVFSDPRKSPLLREGHYLGLVTVPPTQH